MNWQRAREVARIEEAVKNHRNEAAEEFAKEAKEQETQRRWIKTSATRKGQNFMCPFCRKTAYYIDCGTRGKNPQRINSECGYKYCPNCGKEIT